MLVPDMAVRQRHMCRLDLTYDVRPQLHRLKSRYLCAYRLRFLHGTPPGKKVFVRTLKLKAAGIAAFDPRYAGIAP